MQRVWLFAQSLAFAALIGLLLFGGAGRLDIPAFWAYLGVWVLAMVGAVGLVDPSLYEERLRPGGRKIQAAYWLLMLPIIAHWVLAGLDVGRQHWSDTVPRWLQLLGFVGFAAGLVLMVWAMHVNRFFSSVVRIQSERGHQLITGGPYRWIRHPGYTSGILQGVASGIALGSWISVVPLVIMLPMLLVRTLREERFLRENLPGYVEYASRVRFRLVPGLW